MRIIEVALESVQPVIGLTTPHTHASQMWVEYRMYKEIVYVYFQKCQVSLYTLIVC